MGNRSRAESSGVLPHCNYSTWKPPVGSDQCFAWNKRGAKVRFFGHFFVLTHFHCQIGAQIALSFNSVALCRTVRACVRRSAGEIEPLTSRLSRSLNVIEADMDRLATYDFLLMIHSNCGHIPCYFRDKRQFPANGDSIIIIIIIIIIWGHP